MNKGLVIKSISGEYTVFDSGKQIICKPRGVFRHKDSNVKVGDWVTYDENNKIIYSVDKRINDLERPVIANVEKGIIVTSVVQPELNLNLLDKLICLLEYNDIKPILIFTKIDLLEDEKQKQEFNKIKYYYEKIGYLVITTDEMSLKNRIEDVIGTSVCVLTGQSGVGKSTILNRIDDSLTIKTNDISMALGRGKHTTRHIELFPVGKGFLADSPGFGSLSLNELSVLSLSQTFVEFFENSSSCKYSPCYHINEPQCKVKELVLKGEILKSRYDNYLQFVSEIKNKKY